MRRELEGNGKKASRGDVQNYRRIADRFGKSERSKRRRVSSGECPAVVFHNRASNVPLNH